MRASCSHLSSLVLKPHLDDPNAESRLRSQRLPHLKTSEQTIFSVTHTHTQKHPEILCPYNITATFPNRHTASWLALISANVERMQQSFWTSWLLHLQSLGTAAAPVSGPGLWRQFSYLSMTFGADRLRYTRLPRLTQTRMLLTTSKLGSEVGKIFLI